VEKIQPIERLFSELPPFEPGDLNEAINQLKKEIYDSIIVLDDDPTGTQTVHDIPVLTDWSYEMIFNELEGGTPLFYVLTNSRSLTSRQAEALTLEIARNIWNAAAESGKRFMVISRSDSTLRGHFPEEMDALIKGCNYRDTVTFLIPAFFEGGRYTIGDIHYVREGHSLIPAAQTPFALDKVFGYENSDLKKWVIEKSKRSLKRGQIKSVSISDLRILSDKKRIDLLNELDPGDVCIVNAAEYFDLKQFCLAVLQSSINPVFRSAASFVSAIACQSDKPFLDRETLKITSGSGGLVVVGSYVPKTTDQLHHLLENRSNEAIEIQVSSLINAQLEHPGIVALNIDQKLLAGKLVILFTSRDLVSAASDEENLQIGQAVSIYLSEIVAALNAKPQFIVTKGGITSSDIATKALGARRAMIKGQILPGVPVWQTGPESKFPGLCQVVFPGNVGEVDGLTKVVQILGG
jgi:uncharacterized protein YgbK (DUF1537 family)